MTDSPTLRHRLEQAADDSRRPLTTDVGDLLDRARAVRADGDRRTTLAAAVLTACALVGTALGVRAALPDERGAGARTRCADAERARRRLPPLTDAQVVRRCAPQLQKYADLPDVRRRPARPGCGSATPSATTPRATWSPSPTGAAPGTRCCACCPSPGSEDAPVPFEAFQPKVPAIPP